MDKIGHLDLGNNDTLVANSIQMQWQRYFDHLLLLLSQNPQHAQSVFLLKMKMNAASTVSYPQHN